jgi:Cdc6-like AAA superfamily ATPase
MAAKKVNPIVALLRLPEGYTVRLVRGELKVVAARKRKVVAVAKESKSMLNPVRATFKQNRRQILDWQESLQSTCKANKGIAFTSDEMYTALQSLCQNDEDEEYLDSEKRVAEYLNGLHRHPMATIRLQKDGEFYKYVG